MRQVDRQYLAQLRNITGWRRLRLRDYEEIKHFQVAEKSVKLIIETYEVKETRREDRFNKHGLRMMIFKATDHGWVLDFDVISWDEEFVPFVHRRYGSVQTPEELAEQREFEQMCYRPGTKMTPLDSYDRVLDPIIRSTDKMERHY